jgi:predicted nucleotidyltransferase component of viral defense system
VSFPDHPSPLLGKEVFFSEEHITSQFAQHKGVSKELYLRALNSFEFLAQLRDCGLDPLFKGGSAAQLLFPAPLQRLSIDLDFATGATCDEIETVLDAVNHKYGNGKNRHELRGKDLPPYLRLYNVYFSSVVDQKETKVALDFLLHEPHYKTKQVRIKTFFYECALRVRVPTIEALLGDKMTVIADGTIGKNMEEHAQSYAKQLYDLHTILAEGNGIQTNDAFNAFQDVFAFEKVARNRTGMVLQDAVESKNQICQIGAMVGHRPAMCVNPAVLRRISTLKSGIDGLAQYTSSQLKLTYSKVSTLGGKLAFLCTLLTEHDQGRLQKLPPLAIFRDDNPRVQDTINDASQLDAMIEDFRASKHSAKVYLDVNVLKKINPASLVFWHAAYFPSKAIDAIG